MWAVTDQVFSSGTNFVPSLLLARLLGPAAYGTFSVAFLAWFLTLSVIGSAFMQSYTIAASSLAPSEWRELTSRASGLVVTAGVAAGTIFAVAGSGGWDILRAWPRPACGCCARTGSGPARVLAGGFVRIAAGKDCSGERFLLGGWSDGGLCCGAAHDADHSCRKHFGVGRRGVGCCGFGDSPTLSQAPDWSSDPRVGPPVVEHRNMVHRCTESLFRRDVRSGRDRGSGSW